MLTTEEVKARATTPEKALDVSIQHYEEALVLTEDETRRAHMKSYECFLSSTFCGLCQYKDTACIACSDCILEKNNQNCHREGRWRRANFALDKWYKKNGSFDQYKTEILAMLKLLKKLKQENYGDDKMTKQDEIKAQIKQNKVDQEAVAEKGRELEKELEQNKTVYSVGDRFEYDGEKVILMRIWLGKRDEEVVGLIRLSSGETWNCAFDVKDCYNITVDEIKDSIGGLTRYWDRKRGIFDDLKRNAEDLERFTVAGSYLPQSMLVEMEEGPTGRIGIKLPNCSMWNFKIKTIAEFHQKLGQMLATIRRQNAN